MSYLARMTLRQALPILKKTYSSFGLKSIVLLKDQEWVNVITVIDFTHRKADDLSKEYRRVEGMLGALDFENFKVILESRHIGEIASIIKEMETGNLTVGGIRTRLLCSDLQEIADKKISHSHFLVQRGEYTELKHYSLSLRMNDAPEGILSSNGISASILGIKSLEDLGQSWIGLENLTSTINILFNFPVYARMIRIDYKGGTEIAANLLIHRKMIDSCKAWILRMTGYDIAPILERREYSLASCERTIQDDFAYILLEHEFNALDPNDNIQISLVHKDLGSLISEETRLLDLVKPSEESLIQSFNLFDAGKEMEKNLLNPKNDKNFVKAVSWLLEMIHMRSINLDGFEAVRENKTERGSADILAYDLVSEKLFVIDCTVNPPPTSKIDKIRNTASYVSSKINNVAKPLIITPRNASASKHESREHGVLLLDKTDLEKLLDRFKKGKMCYKSFRDSIFQE